MFTRKEDEIPSSGDYTLPSTPTSGGSTSASVRSTAGPADANAISKGTRIQGDVHCEGDLRIDGEVTGKIFSKSKVMVGKSGFVDGNIQCVQAEIYGRVKGSLIVRDHLFLRSEAKMDGDVLTTHFEMEPTVRFNGKCTMQDKVELQSSTTNAPESKTTSSANTNSSSGSNAGSNILNKNNQNNKSNSFSGSDTKKNAEKDKATSGLFQK